MLIYPNIINMLGEMTVELNGLCMDPTITYVLMIEQRPVSDYVFFAIFMIDCDLSFAANHVYLLLLNLYNNIH